MRKGIRFTQKKIKTIERNKSEIEKKANVEMEIRGLDVNLEGKAVDVLRAENILDALFEGFTLDESFKLLNKRNQLKVVHLNDYTSSGMSLEKLKGRIIGENGRTKELIEELAKVSISVHGKNVSLIGGPEGIGAATRAVEMLVNGKPHGKVYRYLEQNQPGNKELI
ncbi:MAG: hypothetical protein ACLFTQ_01885 [Candidatus Aenigmatarchaeota archaeon]